jgi:BirA family biotin operon repressor/biotin-[acetyl-CoA-carboxylase] ligase
VLGIGLNVSTRADEFPGDLREIATSLRVAAGDAAPSRAELLARLLEALEERIAQPPSRVVANWRERDALLGRTVRWQGGEGTARGIDEGGSLVVETDAGRVSLDAGEVHLHR